jgi:glycolate dehydrogenase FAD-binding subunit
MTITANLAARLGQVIGTHGVVSAPEELAAHAADGILPQAIAGPATAEQVSEIVRLALAEKLAIQAFGSRSKCEMGMPPARCDIALDMTHLRDVAHYDAGDLTLSVDAGMPLRELADFLSGHGQFLPLAVPCFENTTVGGAVASGIDSALRQQYGSARDFLIGAEFVDGTGRLCKSGGRVVKNVTGYDLHKLLIGSLGTLGVITRLNFRTFPLPAASGACLARFRDCKDALVFRKAIERKGLPLADVEILSPGTSEILRAILERTDANVAGLLRSGAWCAYCSYEGNQPVVARITGELKQAAKDADAPECTSLEKSADEQLGGMLREAYEWLRWASRATVVQRVVLPQVTRSVFGELERMAGSASLRSSLLLRAGGVLYVSLFADSENDAAMLSLANVALNVSEVVRKNRGHSTILHAPVPVKTRVAAARITLPDESLQLRLKQAFDPAHIFAPGRIVGAI